MRRILTLETFRDCGLTRSAIRWGESAGRWRKISYAVYGEGPEDPTEFDRAIAAVVASGGAASGALGGVLLGLDSVTFVRPDFTVPPGVNNQRPGARRRYVAPERIAVIDGVRCVDALQILADLAAELDDEVWEQVLESALRKRLTTVADVEDAARGSQPGANRMRRVLALRPDSAAPTESLLETLMVQLARGIPGLADPVRQYVVYDRHGVFVARVDLAWPELGIFIELDDQQHKGQPVYDAHRQTAVTAATGWLCGRFTWKEVVHLRRSTARRLADIVDVASRRPASA